ncbi:MAG: rhomboid family intramembrane serine protease [Leptolyngbyaceae cyanobacterium SM1_3_5]|nr:rhomboid family intramembrane serine protease [Leptolyngbyaceae cyanobacterium SM1_3_5]
MSSGEMKSIAREFKLHVAIIGGLVALAWAIEIVDLFLGGWLNRFGILPRNAIGLRGILLAPLLHGGIPHLIGNTIPFIILGWLVMLRRTSDFFVVTAIVALLGGLGTWLFGAPATHIGASGVIFGYFGFLIARGYFERSFVAIGFSVLVAILYGGMIWGVLPGQYGISWEGHLFGFLGGIFTARLIGKRPAAIDKYPL